MQSEIAEHSEKSWSAADSEVQRLTRISRLNARMLFSLNSTQIRPCPVQKQSNEFGKSNLQLLQLQGLPNTTALIQFVAVEHWFFEIGLVWRTDALSV